MKVKKHDHRQAAPGAAVPEAAGAPAWPWLLGLLLAVYAAFQVYAPILHGPFLFDDDYLPFRVPGFTGEWRAWVTGVRPLLMFTYWVNFRLSGADTFSYHLLNVLFHTVAAVLVFFVLRRLLARAGECGARLDILSLFGGGLFLLHPLQTESVSYVASRSENLSVMLLLAAFAVFLYRRREAVSWRVAAAVLVLFGAALASKEHTLVLPMLLLLTDYYWNPGFSFAGVRRNWRLYLPVAVGGLGGAVFVWRVLATATTAGLGMKDLRWYEYFFSQCRALFVYLRLMVLPYGQSIDYDFPISRSLADHGAVVGMIALAAVTAAAWFYRRRYPLASYGWFAFLILMAPTSSVMPIRDPIAERRLYLAMPGLLLVLLEFLRRLRLDRRALAGVLGAVLVVAAVLTYNRNLVWSDRIALWQDTVEKAPRKLRPRFQLAYAYYDTGRCGAAVTQYAAAAQLEKPAYDLLVDWAQALDCAGRSGEAVAKLREAAKLEPSAHVYSQIGMMYGKQGKLPEALEALAMAERADAGFAMTYVYRGQVHLLQKAFAAAVQDYRRALSADPNNDVARQGLAQAEARLRAL